MFFTISKILNYLAMSQVLICICFLVALFVRNGRWKTRLHRLGTILLFFFTNDFIVNEFIRLWEVKPIPFASLPDKPRYGIVLTGTTLPEMKPDDRIYFQRGADRVIHAFQLYKLGKVQKLLISGGSGRLIDIGQREADELKSVLILMGMPESDILTENKSRNTAESARESVAILKSLTRPEDCLLITSAFHMRRSVACFRGAGWEVQPFSVDFYSHPRKFTPDILLVPRYESLGKWNILFKEWTGMTAYWLARYI
jgi:uncharacterized SAM-binding protein YcdF (DUF218 family)